MGAPTTVVFTDLIGSTTVFETLGNARATQTVTQITRQIRDIFESHQGRVVKTLGDGVLAVFASAQAAIDATVAMQRAHQKALPQLSDVERMPVRVGVATGVVEVVDNDCYGDAVNVAARLNDLAGPHEIWVNSAELDYHDHADGVHYRYLGSINVRGRAEPCVVYRVDWRENESAELLTMQAELDPLEPSDRGDVLGQEIELSNAGQSRTFKSFELPIHVGRIRNSDFVVNDPRVSRTHARLEWRHGRIMLVDVSSYGCWVRFESGGELQLRREECVLHGRGEIALGAALTDPSAPMLRFVVR
jgi:class 3 adenylate cyclase